MTGPTNIRVVKSVTGDGYDMYAADRTLHVGCQTITKAQARRAFKAIGEWLGYDIED